MSRRAEDQIKADMIAGAQRNNALIVKQAMLEIIQIAVVCETYTDFRNALYAKALDYLGELESEGIVKAGTTATSKQDFKEHGIPKK